MNWFVHDSSYQVVREFYIIYFLEFRDWKRGQDIHLKNNLEVTNNLDVLQGGNDDSTNKMKTCSIQRQILAKSF